MIGLSEYFQKHILLRREEYQWLIEPLAALNLKIGRLADFGCGEGQETLLLMCMLNAGEGVGIDKCDQSIRNAQNTLRTIQDIIWVKGAPNDAPVFLKKSHLEEVVKFYTRDITEPIQLPPDYYDIAFCNYVLYHIWLDQGGEDKTRKAIHELLQIVRPGGVIAVCEPTQHTGGPIFSIGFRPLFERIDLALVHVEEIAFEGGQNTEYIYIKGAA